MSSALRTVPQFRTATPGVQAKRLPHLQSFATVSLAAIFLSGCGGGDGSASSDGAQSSTPESQYRSFVSTNPQVKAAVAAQAETKHDESSDQAAKRSTDESASAQQESSSADASSSGSSSGSSANASSSDDASESSSEDSSEDSSDSSSDGSSDGSSDDSSSDSASSGLVDTLISDMREMNDHPLKNVNRVYGFSRGPGYVLQGNNSRGNNFLLPWFVQFEGEGNAARNTRVQMRNLRLFVKSRSTGEWKRVIDTDGYYGIQCDQGGNYYQCPQVAQISGGAEGASSLPLSGLNLHGWWGGRKAINGGDISAIVATLQARLITDPERGGDDRSRAKYLIQVGADYYPKDAPPDGTLPPVGISRAKLVTNDWQTFSLSTLNDVGKQEPGGGISSDELRDNPPPLD